VCVPIYSDHSCAVADHSTDGRTISGCLSNTPRIILQQVSLQCAASHCAYDYCYSRILARDCLISGMKRCALIPGEEETVVSNINAEVTVEMLQAFADAWNRHDPQALMSFMSDDCVFEASAGPEVSGTRYVGREAVKAGYMEVFASFPDAHWGNARHLVHGNRGVSEWIFTGTRTDGSRVEVSGCDLFTFRDGKIAIKNSYRKNRPPVTAPKGL
jgi:steroid delta-isomerase-like uncharacterized protein